MPKQKTLLAILISCLFLVLAHGGKSAYELCAAGVEADCLVAESASATAPVADVSTAATGAVAPEAVMQPTGLADVTISPARTIDGMDDAPSAELAHYVDSNNPEWMATFGTEAGRQLIEPRSAPGPAPASPPLELSGTWDALSASGTTQVLAIVDAPDGRLFAAVHSDGLRVYAPDGNGVYSWSAIHAGDRGGLASDSVAALALFEGELWVGTNDAGISILDLEANTWRNVNAGNSGLPDDNVNSLTAVQPASGAPYIWVGTQGGGAARYGYSESLDTYLWSVVDTGDGLPDNGVRDVAVVIGSATRTFFSTDDGLARLAGRTWTYFDSGNTGDCALDGARELAVDHNDALWIAATRIVPALSPATPDASGEVSIGACRQRQGLNLSIWELYDKNSPGLPTNYVSGFSVDHAGRTWMSFSDYESGSGGAAVFDQDTWLIFELPDEPLQSSNVRSVHAAGERVWFGDGNSTSFTTYTTNWLHFDQGDIGGTSTTDAILLEEDDAWVGQGKRLARHDGTRWLGYDLPVLIAEITDIARGSDGVLWVATAGQGIFPFTGSSFGAAVTTDDGLPSNDVRALEVDGDGRLWAATGGGLALQGDGYWLRFTTATSGLASDDLRDLAADPEYNLWLATPAGLSILDISAADIGTWSQQTTSDGLPGNDVRALDVDPDGHVWAATAAGVAEWDPDAATWAVHDEASGALPGDDTISIASDPVGRIWAGTGSGLAHYEAHTWRDFHVTGSTLDADRVRAVASDGDLLWAGAQYGVSVRGVISGPIGFHTPEITSFSPTQGAPGTTVTISGTHFDPRGPEFNTVLFCCFSTGPMPHHEAHIISATSSELVVKVPLMAATGQIQVVANGLKSEWSTDDFELAPVITDIGSSCVALGSMVEVYGAGFNDGFGAPYVKIGDGPERLADYSDPNIIRQFVRPGDTEGPVRIRLTNGNSATSSESISISQPQLAGIEVQQAIEGMTMVWGKRTLVQVRLVSTGALCPADVDGGSMVWRKTNNTTQPAAQAYFPSSEGLSVHFIEQKVSLDTTVNFVADFGYDGIFPLSQLAGGRITLTNGPVELMTIDVGTNRLSFTDVSDQVRFSLMAIMPENSTYSGGPTFWDKAWDSMADVARVYPQRDIGWRWGSGSWIHKVNAWHSWGPVNLDTDDYSDIQGTVHDYVDPSGNNQAMAMIHQDLYIDGPSGKAPVGGPTAVTFNFEDDAAPTFLQEAIHGMDWVQEWSPNHDGANEGHSLYDEGEITDTCMPNLGFRQALKDQYGETRRVVRLRWNDPPYEFGLFGCNKANMPRSAMSYVPSDDNASVFLEPVDFLHTLATIQQSAQQRQIAQARLAPYAGDPTLRLSGSISLADAVAIRLSYLEPPGEEISLPAPQSDYAVQIRSGSGELLYEHPFPALFEGTHHGADAGDPVPASFNLRVPFPDGATRAEIRHGDALLWSADVSANAPTVAFTGPGAGTYDANGVVPVSWNGSDADGDDLQYRLEYSADGGATWFLIAPFLEGNSLDWQPGHVPAGSNARLRLQVSDGFNTATALSPSFTLNPHPPWAMISTPDDGAVFPEGTTISLSGSSMTSHGPHTGQFRWTRSDEPQELGTTDAVSYTLGGPGTYVFEFQVTADGMSDTDAVSITVVADYDNDGMPNEWELQYRLNPLDAADALEDPDNDGLFNAEEYRYGTNPRQADSDGDGDSDGDEVEAGVDPTDDTQQIPDTPVLSVGPEALAYSGFAGNPAAGQTTFWVTNGGTGTLTWSASSNASWLTVTPNSDTAPTEVTIRASAAELEPGTYNGAITFTAAGAADSPQTIPVTLEVTPGFGNRLLLPVIFR